jgi:outer membrane protein insertion porin family
LSSTVEAYNQRKEVEDLYRLNSIGGGLRFSYPVFDYTRFHWRYGWDQTDVSEIEKDAPDSIKEREGANITSLIGLGLVYDSRDKVFNPTDGSKHSLSFEFAGLGGDVGYNKYVLDTGKYFPLFSGLIGFVHGKIGYVHRNFDEMWLPDYEKFYLGGINSLRGFGYRGVYISDTNEAGESIKTGGDYMVQLNAEIIFPIYEKAGVMGVVFYDRGNVYEDAIEWQRMRHSVGGGIRWFSPIAPIRIEYGHILDRSDEDDSSGRWEFTMGGAF